MSLRKIQIPAMLVVLASLVGAVYSVRAQILPLQREAPSLLGMDGLQGGQVLLPSLGGLPALKSLKSNGRPTLKLDPSARALAALPALPLEDGDRVYAPGDAAALGAVNNESVMIYKPGKTIGDMVRAAGVADDAETDSAFVLRADGSAVSKKDSSDLFGSDSDTLPVMPDDTSVFPAKLDRESGYVLAVRSLKDGTQIISNLGGIGAVAIKTLRNLVFL